MNQKEIISVIFPIYNLEDYLEDSLECVINQTYTKLQIILVDDGSTDASKEICDKYAAIDERIEVIHKKNGGAASARNVGLSVARGNYVIFFDGDDYFSEDIIKKLYELTLEYTADITMVEIAKTKNRNYKVLKQPKEKIKIFNNIQAIEDLLYKKNINNGMWNKLIKKEFFNNIRFPEGKIYEDYAIMYKLFYQSIKLVKTNQIHYIYYQRTGSVMNDGFSDKRWQLIQFTEEIHEWIKINCAQLSDASSSRMLYSCLMYIREVPMNNKKYNEKISYVQKLIKEHRKIVVKDKNAPKSYRIIALVATTNFKLLKKICNISKKIYNNVSNN